MTKEQVEEIAKEREVEISMFSDYETCILGLTTEDRVVYSMELMIKYLMEKDEMSLDDALDYISYNTLRALDYYPADTRPVVLDDFDVRW